MNHTIILLKPRVLSIKNRSSSKNRSSGFNIWIVIAGLGILFWGGVFAASVKVLSYVTSIEGLGHILAYKLLSMLLITVFSLLIFSSILTSLSTLYLSQDLSLVHSLPVQSHSIFTARFLESTADSAWMVIIYTLPVFIAFGIVLKSSGIYYLIMAVTLILLSFSASAFSAILVMLAVLTVPANRLRSIFIFLGLMLFLLLFIAFRMLRPERLVDPEFFSTTLIYLKSLNTPSSPLLPTTWAFDALTSSFSNALKKTGFNMSLILAFTGTIVTAGVFLSHLLYFKGLAKAQTAVIRFAEYTPGRYRFFPSFSSPARAIAAREIKTFFRDQTQWSQLFLIAGLILIYLYNFSVLPLEKAPIKTIYLQNMLSFLNIGLAGFVLIAITARFAFPAVSLEKEAFWLVKTAPIPENTFLWIKFAIYFIPLLILTEILIVATNVLLHVTPFMMILSTATIFFIVPGIVSMGIGLGAAFPEFKSENPAQAVTSFGGFLFMVLSATFIAIIIMLEAGPVYRIFMAGIQDRSLDELEWIWTIGSFGTAFCLSGVALIFPMKYGKKRLSRRLF